MKFFYMNRIFKKKIICDFNKNHVLLKNKNIFLRKSRVILIKKRVLLQNIMIKGVIKLNRMIFQNISYASYK